MTERDNRRKEIQEEIDVHRTKIITDITIALGKAAVSPWTKIENDPEYSFRFSKLFDEKETHTGWVVDERIVQTHNAFTAETYISHAFLVTGSDVFFDTNHPELLRNKPKEISAEQYHRKKLSDPSQRSTLTLGDYRRMDQKVGRLSPFIAQVMEKERHNRS